MFELLSLLGGGVLRLFPSVLEFFTKKRDLEHELLLLDRQMDLEKLRWQFKSEEIKLVSEAQTESEWAKALPAAQQTVITGLKWIDAMNASVRPILTYWWCLGLYTVYKFITVFVAIEGGAALLEVASVLVTDFDRSVIGSIIGFWFLDRALRKMNL
tara:strand:+ start:771 stop:1241 length:471 start_codon:yes stop_codon:yes gene_type:complete